MTYRSRRRSWRPARWAAVLVAGALVSACGGGGPVVTGAASTSGSSPTVAGSPGSPGATATGPLLELHRSGGLAGVDDAVRVDRSGAWSATRRGRTTTGRLPDGVREDLRTMTAAPWWTGGHAGAPDGTAGSTAPGGCADGFRYTVTAAGRTATTDDCRLEAQPELARLVEAVVTGTGL